MIGEEETAEEMPNDLKGYRGWVKSKDLGDCTRKMRCAHSRGVAPDKDMGGHYNA